MKERSVTRLRNVYYLLFCLPQQRLKDEYPSLLILRKANIQYSHTHWEYTALSTGITLCSLYMRGQQD